MSKVRTLTLFCIVLVLLNIVTLFFFFTGGRFPNPERNRNYIIEQLHFDAAQTVKYDSLIRAHRKAINATQEQVNVLKNQLYAKLNTKNDAAQTDSLIQVVGMEQTKVEKINFQHFNDIKSLCTAQQLPAFESLSKELARMFSHKPPPRRDER